MVAHSLQLIRDPIQGQQEAQVAGHGRLRRDRHGHQRGNCALDLVDLAVGGDHLRGEGGVTVHERVVGPHDLFLHHAAHPQDAVLDAAHLGVEALASVVRPAFGLGWPLGRGGSVGRLHDRLPFLSGAHPNRPEM